MRIDEKIRRLQSVNLNAIINDSARENEPAIIKLNQDQMWERGVMNVNKPQEKLEYASSTIRQKRKKAAFKKTQFITLRWFGDFYKSMKLIFFKDRFVVSADDLKWANWLEPQDRFSNALGMTPESMKRLRALLKPSIVNRLKKAM